MPYDPAKDPFMNRSLDLRNSVEEAFVKVFGLPSKAKCLTCGIEIPAGEGFCEGCGCSTCEGGGWVQVFSPNPPAFEECPDCYNPNKLPSP